MTQLSVKERNSIESILDIFENLFKWGNEGSTYKLSKCHPIEYNKDEDNYTFKPKSYLFYVLQAERMAAIQWSLNMNNSVYINRKYHTWDSACKKLLPDWRKKYVEYSALSNYYGELPSRKKTIIGLLLSSERIGEIKNFGWKIALYLRRRPIDYENKIKQIYYEQSKKMWLSICSNINYKDYIKIS